MVVKKTFRYSNVFFLQPLMPQFRHSEHYYGKRYTCICSVITVKDAMSNWKSSIKIRILLLLGAGMLGFAAGSVALSGAPVENKGAAEIKLANGKRGPVPFPHRRHQDKLGDCDICHSVFPQKAGIIEELKAQDKLKKHDIYPY